MDNLSDVIPSKVLQKDAVAIYKGANDAQKRELIIDPHLMSEQLGIDQPAISMVSARWSPLLGRQTYYLAYLTNFGGCEIRSVNKATRRWDVVVCDVTKHWLKYCETEGTIKSFHELMNAWRRLRLTAFSWNVKRSTENLTFATISTDGCIAFHELNADGNLRVILECNTKSMETNLLEWITFNGKNDALKSFIIAGDAHGNVSLYDVRIDNASENVCGIGDERKLFSEDDGVRANGIQWEYCDKTDLLMVCLCKGMHFFVFLLSSDGLLLTQQVHYVGHLMLSGN